MALALLVVSACIDVKVEPVDDVDTGEAAPAAQDPDPEVVPPDTGIPEDTAADAENERLFQALFDPSTVKQVHIELDAAAIAALETDPFTYVVGAAEIEGTPLADVGVRLKGNSSFRGLDDKPALKLRFDKFAREQRYAGLKRLTLNNMVGDPSQTREVVAYHLFNAAGLSAPHAAFAQVWINGEDYGLYTALEPMDSEYVERRYEFDEGNLWAGNDSADLTAEGVPHFELVTGPGGTELEDAAMVLATAADDYYETASEVIDMEQFLDFFAWTQVVGTMDAYPYHLNDYFLYSDPGDGGRLDWSPWGLDEAWDPLWTFQWGHTSTVAHQCLLRDSCRVRFYDHLDAALATYETLDAASFADELDALTEPYVVGDTRRPWSVDEVRNARSELWDMLAVWSDVIRRGYWIEPVDTGAP
jgi:hypothetical protein